MVWLILSTVGALGLMVLQNVIQKARERGLWEKSKNLATARNIVAALIVLVVLIFLVRWLMGDASEY